MSLNTNPLGKFTRTTVPVPRRARPILGDFTDRGRYYHCRKCGFICDVNRDTILPKNRADIGVVAISNRQYFTDELGRYLTDEIGNRIYYLSGDVSVTVIHGCPLCGSTRWKE